MAPTMATGKDHEVAEVFVKSQVLVRKYQKNIRFDKKTRHKQAQILNFHLKQNFPGFLYV